MTLRKISDKDLGHYHFLKSTGDIGDSHQGPPCSSIRRQQCPRNGNAKSQLSSSPVLRMSEKWALVPLAAEQAIKAGVDGVDGACTCLWVLYYRPGGVDEEG